MVGLQQSHGQGVSAIVLLTAPKKTRGLPARQRDLASRHQTGLTLQLRNWKSENRGDAPQGTRQLHCSPQPPALPARREYSPCGSALTHGRHGDGSCAVQDGDHSHTSSVHDHLRCTKTPRHLPPCMPETERSPPFRANRLVTTGTAADLSPRSLPGSRNKTRGSFHVPSCMSAVWFILRPLGSVQMQNLPSSVFPKVEGRHLWIE